MEALVILDTKRDGYWVSDVARDADGSCLWWYRQSLVGRPHPSDGETVAMLHGIRFALSCDWRRVVIETDCLSIFQYLSSGIESLVSYGAIFNTCLAFHSYFETLLFSFIRRSGNSIDHAIATATSLSCNEGLSLPYVMRL